MEYQFIKEQVKPEKIAKRGKFMPIITKWLATDNKTLKFICKNSEEKKSCRTSCNLYKKTRNADFVVYNELSTYNVYLVRA